MTRVKSNSQLTLEELIERVGYLAGALPPMLHGGSLRDELLDVASEMRQRFGHVSLLLGGHDRWYFDNRQQPELSQPHEVTSQQLVGRDDVQKLRFRTSDEATDADARGS